MRFGEIILKNLWQRATRTLLTTIGLAVAVAATIVMWNTAWGYAGSAGVYYATRGVDIVVVRAGISNRLTSRLGADLSRRLAALSHVAHVDGVLTEMVSLGGANLLGIPFRGYAADNAALTQMHLREGRTLLNTDRGSILIGSALADSLGKHAGETLEIEGTPFNIAGIFLGDNPFDANSIVGSLADVQKLMGRAVVVSEFQLTIDPSARNDATIQELSHTIETLRDDAERPLGFKAQPTNQFVQGATEVKLGAAMAWATTAIVISLSLLGMLNTMLTSVAERTRELGLLTAIGWRRSRIVRLVLGESIIISALASIVGSLFAAALVQALAAWPLTSLLVPARMSAVSVIIGVVGAILTGITGSIYPALYAASLSPIEALRHD
jgi:putative ABC transport system permease protein